MNINKNNYEAYFLDYHEGTLSPQEVADLFLFLSLHPELKKEFESFENILLEDFAPPIFENKDSLKKNITPANREGYFIRAIEGTLEPAEQLLLEQFLKGHPQFLPEFQLFQKTRLQADLSIVFEDKPLLKQPALITDDQLIASMEGLLTAEEQRLLDKQLATHREAQKIQATFSATKLTADTSIVYPYKQELKRKEKKVIPLYYYAASIAASVILLIGFFFFFRSHTNTDTPRFAEQTKQQLPTVSKKQTVLPNAAASVQQQSVASNVVKNAVATKKEAVNKVTMQQFPATVETNPLQQQEQQGTEPAVLPDNSLAANDPEKPVTPVSPVDSSHLENKPTAPAIVKNGTPAQSKPQEFVSINDLLLGKIKNLFSNKDAVKPNTSTTASKKISGWDIAGVLARGLSNLTGKRFEVKPQFNEDGNLKAYALGLGKLEISKGVK